MPNAATATNILPIRPTMQSIETPEAKDTLAWWQRRMLDLGAMTTMAPNKPYWSTTMVTAWVAVIGLVIVLLSAIGGLYVYTRDTSAKDGYERGVRDQKDAQRDEEMKTVKRELKLNEDDETPTPTPTPRGKK